MNSGHGDHDTVLHSIVGWNIQGLGAEKVSDPHFHEYLCDTSCRNAAKHVDAAPPFIRQAQIASPALIAFVEPKRGADPAVLKHYKAYHSARTERVAEEGGFSTVACEDGGATLYVHDRVAAYVKNDHTTAQFPEVVAIEFDKAFFSASSNVIVVVAYISCSELAAAKKYIDTYQTTQLAALSELLCNFRAAGFQVLFFGDVN